MLVCRRRRTHTGWVGCLGLGALPLGPLQRLKLSTSVYHAPPNVERSPAQRMRH